MVFRKDINGLRAIAVISVVLFHFKPSWLTGGFAGVDVFFVISGFLMTRIIFRGFEENNFSILKFYVARANRIIPALSVLCFVLLVFGWFYLSPLDYKALSKHVWSSVSFLSNFIYWSESGYFDAASNEKWLLHTWSLSVEWQFYIIYPLVLVGMRKFMSLKAMKITVLLGTVLGFSLCVVASYLKPNAAYYLLPTRAWEMLFGGLAYLYPYSIKDTKKKALEWFGLLLIVGSFLLASKESIWPGYIAIFPVFGSFLIIQAQRNNSFITGNILFQRLGAWSYSIYLWHWPLVVAIYYFSLSDFWLYIGIIASVLLGAISNYYVEKIKFRNDFDSFVRHFKCKPIYMALFVGFFGSGIFALNGAADYKLFGDSFNIYNELLKQKIVAENKFNLNYTNPSNKYIDGYTCSLDSNMAMSDAIQCISNQITDKAWVVIGDSHGRDFFHALKMAYPSRDIAMLHQSSCAPSEKYKYASSDQYCFQGMSKMMSFLNSDSRVVKIIFSSRYTSETGTDKFIGDLKSGAYKKNTVIVNSGPHLDKDVSQYLYRYGIQDLYKMENLTLSTVEQVNNKIKKLSLIGNINLFDKFNSFCDDIGQCMFVKDNLPLFIDDQHLSVYGVIHLKEKILESGIFN